MYTALKNAKGFIRYCWVDTAERESNPVNVFSDKNETSQSTQLATDFVKTSMAGMNFQKPGMIEEPIHVHD
ncbi:MAG: hypothetical protein ABI402_13130 [Ferruginibacter sp.]